MKTEKHKGLTFFGVVMALLLVIGRIPYYILGHIQEDAYIYFRAAIKLVESGTYGFNSGERVSVCTSHLYLAILALFRLLFGKFYIFASIILGSVITIVALKIIVDMIAKPSVSNSIWIMSSFFPMALLMSYSGMEIPFVVLWIALMVKTVCDKGNVKEAGMLMFLLPWIRPELITLGVLIIAGSAIKDKRVPTFAIVGLIVGSLAVVGFNMLYFGSPVNHTIVAKSAAYSSKYDLVSVMKRLFNVYTKLYLPMLSSYLERFKFVVFASVVVLLICAGWFWRTNPKKWHVYALISVSGLMPAVYAVGAGFFPWYLWPYQLIAYVVCLAFVVEKIRQMRENRKQILTIAVWFVVIMLAIGQWVYSFSWGLYERHQRMAIGKDLNKLIKPNESLMLEPIGYIPYYADCYTHCQIGLASPVVTEYRQKYGRFWVQKYIRDFRPTYLLQRASPEEGFVEPPTTNEQNYWLAQNYSLVKIYEYKPENIFNNKMTIKIANLSTGLPFYLYKIRD